MNKFFVTADENKGDEIRITGPNVNHIKNVLRMRPGEEVLAGVRGKEEKNNFQEAGEYLCRIRAVTADEVTLEILDYTRAARELPSHITLFQGLPKSDKMELIVQKAVELGAYAVAPVAMKRSVVKIEEKKKDAKRKRWQSIAESAAAQSKRSVIPEVLPVMSFAEALKAAAELDVILLPYEDAENMEATRQELSAIRPGQSVGVFIGPEGGFVEEEVAAAKEAGAKVITLGNRILRTETAGLMALSVLGYLLEQ
ncbi:MAG: 16S rRNA (uracil(1498)-N(3))-methyltransferase [Lachnospiraceae bacterium]|nr:16S rRNA (uracil(1498)-N(3))-methyltransferase [Lachnospiraceae bacterium]